MDDGCVRSTGFLDVGGFRMKPICEHKKYRRFRVTRRKFKAPKVECWCTQCGDQELQTITPQETYLILVGFSLGASWLRDKLHEDLCAIPYFLQGEFPDITQFGVGDIQLARKEYHL